MRSAVARFIDHSLRVLVCLGQNLLVTLLRFGEFIFDFFGVKLALFNLSPTFLKNGKDRLLCEALQKGCNNAEANHPREKKLHIPTEALQKECNNAEANHLREKQLPIPAERFSCFTQDVSYASGSGGNYQVHNLGGGRNI